MITFKDRQDLTDLSSHISKKELSLLREVSGVFGFWEAVIASALA